MNTPCAKVCLQEIVAFFQPQFRVSSGELYGAEALARWNHKTLGILGPNHLLPLMNSSELRADLWKRMLSLTIDMLENHKGTEMCIAVNVSADIANSERWADEVAKRVRESHITPKNLSVEITEDVGGRVDTGLTDAIAKLRKCGFNCAIDDFGTGFSSLQRLATTPFSILKIDQCFVRQARTSSVGRKILANTVALAHDLGLSVTAEGIETKEDFERIVKLGCDVAQGYFFAKPMPANQFIEYWATSTQMRTRRAG